MNDGVIIDSNCCIKAVLAFGDVRDYYTDSINEFIHRCKLKEVPIGYFPVIREESERNLVKAISELLRRKGRYIEFVQSCGKGT